MGPARIFAIPDDTARILILGKKDTLIPKLDRDTNLRFKRSLETPEACYT